jgi:hypothetical protein
MNKFLVSLLAVSLVACVDSSSDKTTEEKKEEEAIKLSASLTDDEKKDGWQLLFNGSSTRGWHKFGDSVTGAAWKVADGNLHLDAKDQENLPTGQAGWQIKGGGDIVTDEEYENFHLKLEWKIDTCGNSGIIMYIHEDTAKYTWGWETGPEMQVLDNKCHPDAKIIKHRAGDLYDLITSSKETVKPALEWNKAEIKSLNGKLDLWLNGENVVSTTLWDDSWKKLIAGSKFKDKPDFGTYKKGHIGLQDHGNNVWYRNIKIMKL